VPRQGKRIRFTKNVYREGKDGAYEIRVVVGGTAYYARMPKDSTPDELLTKRAQLESQGRTETPKAERGTLKADTPKYLKLVATLVSCRNRKAHLAHWNALLGDVPRHRINRTDVLAARVKWQQAKAAPRTINHRCETLRHLYHTLDGRRAPTPVDDVPPLHVPRTPIQHIDAETILKVDQELQAREKTGHFTAKTRARFRVLVSTGRRPSEIMRAKKGDVDLERRVWLVRDGKGGWSPGLYLNDDMLAAWKLFAEVDAWGEYGTSAFAKTIRRCGWPEGVRPYNARHSTWIEAAERGADLADIAAGAGHSDTRMTRRHYVPVLNSRMQKLGQLLEGRFGGFPVVPKRGTAAKVRKQERKRG
jgi:integrase